MTEQDTIDLGPIDSFTPGEFKLIKVGRREIGIIRLADDRIFAVANHCPHRGAPICHGAVGGTLLPSHPDTLVYGMEDEVVRCPWHGYEFGLRTGECLFTGRSMRLRTYDVELRDGRLNLLGVPPGDAGQNAKGATP